MIIRFPLNIRAILTGLLLLIAGYAHAQSPEPVFRLDEVQKNYSITAKLPNDGILQIHFARLNDWKGKTELAGVTRAAAALYHQIADSFKDAVSQKNIFLKVPQNESAVTLQYEETNTGIHQAVYQDGVYFPLKSNKDTLRILKDNGTYARPLTLSTDSSQYVRQVEYTFLFRDLEDIESLVEHKETLEEIGDQIDSIVKNYQAKWRNPESGNKRLSIDLSNTTDRKSITVTNNTRFLNNLGIDYFFGVELFMSKPAVTMDISYAYIGEKDARESAFIAINLGGLYLPQFPPDQSSRYASVGLEFGVASTPGGSLNNKSSIGLAYFLGGGNKNNTNSVKLPDMGRIYITYPLSPKISTGFDITTNFKWSKSAQQKKESIAMIGIFLKFNLL